MHLSEETLERTLHDELDPAIRDDVRRHLSSCLDCAARLTAARRTEARVFELLEELDHEPPARGRAETAPIRAADSGRSLLAASLAFLVIAAGILYAIPGSPVRAWMDASLRGPRTPPAPVDVSARSGLAVLPTDPFEVAFAAWQGSGELRLLLVPSERLELTVAGEPVELESGAERLAVSNAGSAASYELRVPRDLGTFRVRVAGEMVFEKRGDSVDAPGTRETDGAYVLQLRRDPR